MENIPWMVFVSSRRGASPVHVGVIKTVGSLRLRFTFLRVRTCARAAKRIFPRWLVQTFARGTRAGASSILRSFFVQLFLTRVEEIVASSSFPSYVICMLIHPLIIVSLVPLISQKGVFIDARKIIESNVKEVEWRQTSSFQIFYLLSSPSSYFPLIYLPICWPNLHHRQFSILERSFSIERFVRNR